MGGGQKPGEHTVDCGYATGQPCGHEHSKACYTDELICGYIVDEDNIASDSDAIASDSNAEHTHTQECYALDCPHERGEHKVNGVSAKSIADWTFIDDDNYLTEGVLTLTAVNAGMQADFDTVVSMLPTQIRAEVEGETDPILVDITDWSCPEFVKDPDGNWPLTGEYTFTAKLTEGYVCEPLPTVKVLVGGAELYAAGMGAFIVEGDTSKCTFTDPILTIQSGATVTIKNVNPQEPTTHRIKVASGATNVNITLAGVNIDTGDTYKPGIDITNATVSLTLAEGISNALKSEGVGLKVPAGANLTIGGSGEIVVAGGYGGAGIGGDFNENGGNITIQGSSRVKATSITGAGIGGGYGGNGGEVIIQDSAQVEAISEMAAGIGGGYNSGFQRGDGGNVKISGPKVHVIAKSSSVGFDIGGSSSQTAGGTLSVTYGATLEMQNRGTNVTNPEYKGCTVITGGNRVQYDKNGMAIPTLTLVATPPSSMALPGEITLKATLSGAASGNANKEITFTVAEGSNSTNIDVSTVADGSATHTITNLTAGTYTFGASFAGDAQNNKATATSISGYTVSLGTQTALVLEGLDSAYTYGDAPFDLSVTGGSGTGAVSISSSDENVADVTPKGDTSAQVTIKKAGEFEIIVTKAADGEYARAEIRSDKINVSPATPDVELTASGGSTTIDPIVLTATVPQKGTGKTPAGTVTFKEGTEVIEANVALDGSGKASCTIDNPVEGSHTYTAYYSGQSDYYSANSATCGVNVELADQTDFAISAPGVKIYGDSDFNLTATGNQSSGGVSYSAPDNGVLTVTEDGKVSIVGAGKVIVTAIKEGDKTYKQAKDTLEITVNRRDISLVTVNVTGSRVYTGSQLQPVFEIEDGNIAITTDDYTSSYGANVDAGTDAGSIELTGKGNYTGTKTVRFDIDKRPLDGAVITLEPGPYRYTGTEVKPAVTGVMLEGIVIPAGAFDVGYTDNTGTGTATVTITAKADSNFSGSASTTFEITRSRSSDSDSSDDGSYTNPHILRGSWVQTETGIWMFRQTNGSYAMNRWGMVDGLWYFFDAEGKMLTGWQFLGGQWYYLCTKEDLAAKAGMKEGAMATGWHFDPLYQKWFYLDTNGAMMTGWREIDGKWHYFNPASDGTRGTMVTDSVIDGRYIDKNGVWNGEA